jgi:hypothetical protein
MHVVRISTSCSFSVAGLSHRRLRLERYRAVSNDVNDNRGFKSGFPFCTIGEGPHYRRCGEKLA